MVVTISPQTEALLQEQAGRLGQKAEALADTLLLSALQTVDEDYEATCEAIAEGLADVEAGRIVSFDAARAQWETQKARRVRRVQGAA